MSDAVEGTGRIKEQIAQNKAAMWDTLEDYKAGTISTTQLLQAFMAHTQAQADYESTILTLMLANGCTKEEIAEFIAGCIGVEWPDVLPDV